MVITSSMIGFFGCVNRIGVSFLYSHLFPKCYVVSMKFCEISPFSYIIWTLCFLCYSQLMTEVSIENLQSIPRCVTADIM